VCIAGLRDVAATVDTHQVSPPAADTGCPPIDTGPPEVAFVQLEAVRVAIIRSIVAAEDVPDFMADALGMVADALRRAGIRPAGPPFARYFSMGAEGLDVAAGFPVAEPFLGSGVVHPGELPAGSAAVTTFVGAFGGLEEAWTALRRRILELGRAPGDDPWEVYFIGPGSGVDEAEWRTELVWPLAPGPAGAGGAEPAADQSPVDPSTAEPPYASAAEPPATPDA
jgi:effector-binding domain-containing protein